MRIEKPADLARIVKTRRQGQGFTQQDVADAVGITRQSLARIERGYLGTSFETVLRIFEKLGISLEGKTDIQHHNTEQSLSPKANAALRAASAALTDPAYRNLDVSPLVAAATAAMRNMNDHTLSPTLSEWQSSLKDLTKQASEDMMKFEHELSDAEVRKALLDAAIEAGDPDHFSPHYEQKASRKEIDRNSNG